MSCSPRIFDETAQVDWPKHLPTMFWQSLLFGSGNYQGAPFVKHAVLPVQQAHFERWLTLFAETVDENFTGTKERGSEKPRFVHCRYVRAAHGCTD